MNQNKFSGRLRSSVLILLAAIVLTALAAAADVRLPGAVEAGSRVSFNAGWRFARFGEQADGSKVAEPEELEMPAFDDKEWRQLDLPHDWGIEGPFKIELPGETGKLPWFGIGCYRKAFTVPAETKGKRIFLEFAAEEREHLDLLIREYRSLCERLGLRRAGRGSARRAR